MTPTLIHRPDESTTKRPDDTTDRPTGDYFPYDGGSSGGSLRAHGARGVLRSDETDAGTGSVGSLCCPDCACETINGAGLFTCPDCSWTGTLR